MKIRITKEIEVETARGPHSFEAGDIVTVKHDDACQLVQAGFAAPYHSFTTARKLAQMKPEDVSILNEITTLFDGNIVDIKIPPVPLDMNKCKLSPAPWGTCKQFDMKIGPDCTLWAYCIRGRRFCPYSSAQRG